MKNKTALQKWKSAAATVVATGRQNSTESVSSSVTSSATSSGTTPSMTSPVSGPGFAGRRRMSFRQVTQQVLKKRREDNESADRRGSQNADTIRKLAENCEQEKKARQSAEQRLEELQFEHDRTTALLERSNKNNDKLREENQSKVDQMEKMRRDMNYLEDRLRSLEHRATEVANLEISVENLKKNLETSQQETRDTERDLRIATRHLEENQKKLATTQKTIEDLEFKMADLKLQVKEEVIRNSKLEEQAEKQSRIKDELVERDHRITQLEKDVEEKSIVLQHCRKCLREEKEKSSKMSADTRANDQLVDDIQMSQSETITLKRLLVAKDTLLVQKSQVLDNIKNLAQSSPKSDENAKILQMIDSKPNSSTATYPQGAKGKDCWQNNRKNQPPSQMNGYSHNQNGYSDPDHSNNNSGGYSNTRRAAPHSAPSHHTSEFFRTALETDGHSEYSENSSISEIYLSDRGRAKTPFLRPHPAKIYQDSFGDFRDPSPSDDGSSSTWAYRNGTHSSNGSRISASVSPVQGNGVRRSQSVKTQHQRDRKSRSPAQRDSTGKSPRGVRRSQSMRTGHDGTGQGGSRPVSSTSSVDKDRAVGRLVTTGDRVLVNMGRKPDGRVNTQGAVIKYLGALDQGHSAFRHYAGLKLDEPVGDTNGTYKGKQFFRVPMQHGKFVRMQKITHIMDQRTGMYKEVHACKPPQNNGEAGTPRSTAW